MSQSSKYLGGLEFQVESLARTRGSLKYEEIKAKKERK